MKSVLLATLMLFCSVAVTFGQWGEEEMSEKPSFRDRIFTGGGLGASFGNNYSFFSVSPIVGYRVSPKLAAGVGLQYRYSKYKYFTPSFSTNDYGASVFGRYNFYGPLFFHAEYEYLNYEGMNSYGEKSRDAFNSVFLGGGFFQPVGRKVGFYLMALYNVTYSDPAPGEFSPYDSPLILRAGITAGF